MKTKPKFRSTFRKMTMAFLLCGMLPLVVFSVIFMLRMRTITYHSAVTNYTQVISTFSNSVEDILDSADKAMGSLYDYQMAEGGNLTNLLMDDTVSDAQKELYINEALQKCMEMCSYLSSIRFVDSDENVYSIYYDQRKTLRDDTEVYSSFKGDELDEDSATQMGILRTLAENKICVNSDDYVFTLVRSYMDTSSIKKARTHLLGRIYADIDVDTISDILEKTSLQNKKIYIMNVRHGDFMFINGDSTYEVNENPLQDYDLQLEGTSGSYHVNKGEIFYHQIGDTEEYAILLMDTSEIYGGIYQTGLIMIMILLFCCFVLIMLYMWFTNSLTKPMVTLKGAMEQLQQGKLDTRVELNTHDELEFIADGFNDMADELQDYINRVYVAEIITKEAELGALKMQIQPHFLYNTLDIIRMTALENRDEPTAELLESLAITLRYVMGQHNDRIRLQEEVDMLREYFVIMRARYQNRIKCRILISEEDRQLYVPKLLLQPLVENAIKHGLRNKKGPGTVEVRSRREEDVLYITITDDGIGMKQEQVDHMMDALQNTPIGQKDEAGLVSVGTKNVYDRIQMVCGPEYGFTISSVIGMGTIITFRLPVWTKEGEENVESGNSR